MYWQIVFFSSYELLLSVFMGLLTIFIVYKILNAKLIISDTDNALKKGNIALGLFCGTIIVCVLTLARSSILPSVSALQTMVAGNTHITMEMVCLSFGYFTVFYIMATIISILVIFSCVWLYMKATVKIDEVLEIKNNNIAVAVMLSIVIWGITIFIQPSVNRFISSLVNYESIENSYKYINEADNNLNIDDENGLAPPPLKEGLSEK